MRIAVVHFMPLEMYPPAMNTLDILARAFSRPLVCTTRPSAEMESYSNEGLSIRRFPQPSGSHALLRLIQYTLFNLGTFFSLLWYRPGKILYYETHSAFPVYLYTRFFNRRARIFFHSHEYFYPEWWEKKAMKLVRYYYRLEKKYIYPRAVWLSQTHAERLKRFLRDIGQSGHPAGRVYPNYPPANWKKDQVHERQGSVLRMVYVGSFASLDLLYIRELTAWIRSMEGRVELDVYSFTIPDTVRDFLRTSGTSYIQIKGPLDYRRMPEVLSRYQAGWILYRAASENILYCAPNKLFEYVSCGLDVFYPEELKAIAPFNEGTARPRVVPLDFDRLDAFCIFDYTDDDRSSRRSWPYTAEEASRELVEALKTGADKPELK